MMVAIVMPCHNNYEELKMTIESIYKLDKPEDVSFSVYVKDGSEQPLLNEASCEDLMGKAQALGIKIQYCHGKDDGPYDAMNIGIDAISSKCRWIWFLNSGDQADNLPSLESLNADCDVVIGCWQGLKQGDGLTRPSSNCGLEMNHRTEIGNGLCHQAMMFNYYKYKDQRYNHQNFKYAAELDYYIDSITSKNYIVDEEFKCTYDNTKGISQGRAYFHYREMLFIYSGRGLKISIRRKAAGYMRSLIKTWLNRLLE